MIAFSGLDNFNFRWVTPLTDRRLTVRYYGILTDCRAGLSKMVLPNLIPSKLFKGNCSPSEITVF